MARRSHAPGDDFLSLCQSLFGRDTLGGSATLPSASFGLRLVLSDLALIQRPWWKICRQAGIFFLREHILLNSLKTASALSGDKNRFLESLQKEGYKGIELTQSLQTVLGRILGPRDSIADWQLLEVPTTGADAVGLRELLGFTQCPPIASFETLDLETLQQNSASVQLDRVSWAVADVPASQEDADWVEMHVNPGLFYQRLIPAEVVRKEKQNWLFRLPESEL
jgi:hypothetical protein